MLYQLRLSFLIFFMIKGGLALSQNETSKWFFGTLAGLDFSTNPPSAITNGAVLAHEGSASISNATGNLLFYTNGLTVWNNLHQVMANGTGLFSNQTSTQAALIIKKPGSANIYFIVTTYTATFYSVVDMSLAFGTGSVIIKNVLLNPSSTEKLAGVKHCNGVDTWFVIHEQTTSNFVSYLVTSGGINPAGVISTAGVTYSTGGNNYGSIGQMKLSPRGNKIGLAYPDFNGSTFAVADFNNSSGTISNYFSFTVPFTLLPINSEQAYGCEFSPDGSKFYGSSIGGAGLSGKIYQWDLCAPGGSTAIISSFYTLNTPTLGFYGGQMQLAQDGKIYISPSVFPAANYLGAIANPNLNGASCNYIINAASLGTGACFYGLPNFVSSLIKAPSINYGQGANCNTTVNFKSPVGCSSSSPMVTGTNWNFGDPGSGVANTSTLNNPVHSYPAYGNYTVSLIVNYAGCVPDTIKQTISVADFSLTLNQLPITCNGLGTATASVLPASGIYSYTWMPGAQAFSTATNLIPGNIYTISVSNVNAQCTKVFTTNITAPMVMDYSLSVNQASATCNGLATATVSALAGGGPYSYTWLPVYQSTNPVINLVPGIYTVVAKNTAMQCPQTLTVLIAAPSVSFYPLSVIQASSSCNGLGAATITALSGSGPYLYNWLPSMQNASVSANLVPGTYSIFVYNTAEQCGQTQTVLIAAPSVSLYPLSVIQASSSCNGLGAATITALSGGGPYLYNWLPSTQNASVSANLVPGTYSIFVYNTTEQCGQTQTVNIGSPALIFAVASITPNCTTGDAKISVINGSGNYVYQWNPGTQSNPLASGLSPGIYSVTITDLGNQCSITKTLQITSLPAPNLTVTILPFTTICQGETATLTVIGANTFVWNGMGIIGPQLIVSPKGATSYPVVGTNTLTGCSSFLVPVVNVYKCTFLEERQELSGTFLLYPNPSSGSIMIESPYKFEFSVYDDLGRMVLCGELESGVSRLNMDHLISGAYVIKSVNQKNISINRFVIQR